MQFLVVYIFDRFFLKFSFNIKDLILKMNDYDFSIQDLCKGIHCNLDFP